MLPSEHAIFRQSRKFAAEIRWLSWWHLLSTLAILTGLVAGMCVAEAWWIRLPLSLVTGLVVVRMFILYHDFLHGAILRRSHLARWLLCSYGLLVLNPPSIWKRSHDHHHRNVGKAFGASIGSYPLMTTEAYAASTRAERWGYAASRHPVTVACGYATVFLYGMCLRSLLANPRKHVDSAVALALHATVLIGLAMVSPALMAFVVLLPMTVAGALGAYLFYAQHNFPGVVVLPRSEWTYCAAALRTSGFIRMGRLARWFTGNIGFHHVHHVNAAIPFYRLPEAMREIVALQAPGMTSLRLADIRRCFGLKLWDSEAGCMTGWERHRSKPRRSKLRPWKLGRSKLASMTD
ncbi:MAG: fatty acid desaturase [Planctomycetota bacterium]